MAGTATDMLAVMLHIRTQYDTRILGVSSTCRPPSAESIGVLAA